MKTRLLLPFIALALTGCGTNSQIKINKTYLNEGEVIYVLVNNSSTYTFSRVNPNPLDEICYWGYIYKDTNYISLTVRTKKFETVNTYVFNGSNVNYVIQYKS